MVIFQVHNLYPSTILTHYAKHLQWYITIHYFQEGLGGIAWASLGILLMVHIYNVISKKMVGLIHPHNRIGPYRRYRWVLR